MDLVHHGLSGKSCYNHKSCKVGKTLKKFVDFLITETVKVDK